MQSREEPGAAKAAAGDTPRAKAAAAGRNEPGKAVPGPPEPPVPMHLSGPPGRAPPYGVPRSGVPQLTQQGGEGGGGVQGALQTLLHLQAVQHCGEPGRARGRAARLPTQPGHSALSPAAGPAAPGRGFPARAARPLPGSLLPPNRRTPRAPRSGCAAAAPAGLAAASQPRRREAMGLGPRRRGAGDAGREDAGLPSAGLGRLPGADRAVPSCEEPAGEASAATAPGGSCGGSGLPGCVAPRRLPAAGAARGADRAAAPWAAPERSAPTCGEAPVRLLPRHISWS